MSENEDKVSVIIPVYKSELYLRACVDSVLNQSYPNLDVLLVDDGSPDNCGAICDEYAGKDMRVRVIHKKNGGQSSARNMALGKMTGVWVMFVDSDDEIRHDMVAKLITYAREKHCDIVRCNCVENGKNGMLERKLPVQEGVVEKDYAFELVMKDVLGSQPCFYFSKSFLWANVRFPEGRIYEDIAALYKMFIDCQTKVGILDQPLYIYNLHDDSTSFSVSPNKNYDRYLAFKERWEYARDVALPYTDYCFYLTFTTAIGTVNYYLRFKEKRLSEEKLQEVLNFLDDNKELILHNKYNTTYYKVMMRLYYLNKGIYKMAISLLIRFQK